MIVSRKDVTAWAVGLVFIVMGSATAVLGNVEFKHLESGGPDDSTFVSVTHRSVLARPIEASVTENPVQLREERHASIPVAVVEAARIAVSEPPIVVIETADGRLSQHPKYLAARRVDSAVTFVTTGEIVRPASDASGPRRSTASVLRELRQLRADNLVLRKLVKALSSPQEKTARPTQATPQPRPRAVMWARLESPDGSN